MPSLPLGKSVIACGAFLAAGLAFANEASAMRHLKATVSVDGKTVLEAGTGDNGDPDADQVWDYLKERLVFTPTAEFATLKIASDAKTVELKRDTQVIGQGRIVVHVRYGGKADTYKLRLIRVPRDEYGREWKVHPEDVDRLFDHRVIHRHEAKRLKRPGDERP